MWKERNEKMIWIWGFNIVANFYWLKSMQNILVKIILGVKMLFYRYFHYHCLVCFSEHLGMYQQFPNQFLYGFRYIGWKKAEQYETLTTNSKLAHYYYKASVILLIC